MREVTCSVITGQFRDDDGKIHLNVTVTNETLCNTDSRPPDTQSCNSGQCPFQWRLGQFREVRQFVTSHEKSHVVVFLTA